MKILNIATNDFGGAGLASLLIHQELKLNGHDSKLVVKNKTSSDDSVIKWETDGFFNLNKLFRKVIRKLKQPFYYFINNQFLFFSLFEYTKKKDILKLREMSKDCDILIVHWIADFFSIDEINCALKGIKPKVYIVPMDMAHLTGGCHFGQGCKEFSQGCQTCPATNNTYLSKKIRTNSAMKAKALFEMQAESLSFCSYINEQCKNSSQPLVRNHIFKLPIKIDNFKVAPKPADFTIFVGSYNPSDDRKGNNHFLLCLYELVNKMVYNNEHFSITLLYPEGVVVPEISISNVRILRYKFAKTDGEMSKIYNMANVFVNNSLDDFGPVTLLHSLLCGVPVVSHKYGYAADFIENGVNGFVIDTNNYSAFSDAIYRIFKGEIKSDSEGIRSLAIGKHYSMKSIAEVIAHNGI
jgi:glycosyltransferase involved in cell wall biosynthesis